MKTGKLHYDGTIDRLDICFDQGGYYGGLHCGETMEVFINGEWVWTRVEKSGDWYLVGLSSISPLGLKVRK